MSGVLAHSTFDYLNNGDSVMIMWSNENAEKKYKYKVYSGNDEGKYRFAGETSNNFFLIDRASGGNDTSRLILEVYDKYGRFLERTGELSVKINSDKAPFMISAVKSYSGVTLNWSGSCDYGNFYFMQKINGAYKILFPTHMFLLNFNDLPKGSTVKIVECSYNGTPLRISRDFVFSEDILVSNIPEEKKLTVVIPAYDNEGYLPMCVDSVISSLMKDIEIIIVDDGSYDNTPAIADWYAENYKGKITAIHNTGAHGAPQARNLGIKAAEGKYIAFADSDDFVSAQMYKELYDKAEKLGCDISVGQYFMIYRDNLESYGLIAMSGVDENFAHSTDELIDMTYSENYQTASVCDKIYRTSVVKEHLMPALLFEDSAWSPVIYSYADKFCYTARPFYCYSRCVEYSKYTLSNFIAVKTTTDEKIYARIMSYNYIIDEGNKEKRAHLLLVSVRLVVRQLIEGEFDVSEGKPFVDFMLEHKDEIKSSWLINSDNWLMERIASACEKYGFSLD